MSNSPNLHPDEATPNTGVDLVRVLREAHRMATDRAERYPSVDNEARVQELDNLIAIMRDVSAGRADREEALDIIAQAIS